MKILAIIIMLIMPTGRVTKWKEGGGKCVPPLVLQLAYFAATRRQLASSSSASLFSPLNGKFCNICLLLSHRRNVLMTRRCEQNTLIPSEQMLNVGTGEALLSNEKSPITEEIISRSILTKSKSLELERQTHR